MTYVFQRRYFGWCQRGLDVPYVTVAKFRKIEKSWLIFIYCSVVGVFNLKKLYYIILYFTIFHYIVPYYIIRYSIILYYIILYYIILYYIILYYIILYYLILYYIKLILHYIILHYEILYYIVLYYIILLHYIKLYNIILHYIIYVRMVTVPTTYFICKKFQFFPHPTFMCSAWIWQTASAGKLLQSRLSTSTVRWADTFVD